MQIWLVFFLTALFALPLPAQRLIPRVNPGSQMHITTADLGWERSLARFVALQADTLILVRPSLDTARLPLTIVSHMEVLMPSYRSLTAMLGGVVGAVGMYQWAPTAERELLPGTQKKHQVVLGMFVGALVGYWLGPGERWREVRYR